MINIQEAQILQISTDNLEFKIVPSKNYNKIADEKKLIEEARKRLGNEIKINIKYVDSIPRTSSGKLRFVISKLKNGQSFD